eukprot:2669740-Amphidinium_carterae.1
MRQAFALYFSPCTANGEYDCAQSQESNTMQDAGKAPRLRSPLALHSNCAKVKVFPQAHTLSAASAPSAQLGRLCVRGTSHMDGRSEVRVSCACTLFSKSLKCWLIADAG